VTKIVLSGVCFKDIILVCVKSAGCVYQFKHLHYTVRNNFLKGFKLGIFSVSLIISADVDFFSMM
jgi:hypothetical protein